MGEVSHYTPIRRTVEDNIVLYYHNLFKFQLHLPNNLIQDHYFKKTAHEKLISEMSKNPFLQYNNNNKAIWEFERIGCGFRHNLLFPPITAWSIVKSKDSHAKSPSIKVLSTSSNSVTNIDRLSCGNNYINCGKSISHISWRPNLSSDRQILACLTEFDDDSRSFIEIWDCGSIRNDLQLKPVLKYCLVQEYGKIREMMWVTPDSIDMGAVEAYPYKLNDFSRPQQLYGHLLLVGADGSMRVIPVPEFLDDKVLLRGEDAGDMVPVSETVTVTGKSAVLRLGIGTSCDSDTSRFFGSPTCVGWNSRFFWSLVVGYSSGYIAIFDLSCAHHTRFDYMNNYLGAMTHVRVSYSPITSVALSSIHSPQINVTVKPNLIGVNNFTVDLNQRHQLVDMFHLDDLFWKSIWPLRSDILISVSLKRDKVFIKMILSANSVIIPISGKITSISFSDSLNTLLIGTEDGTLLGLSLNESNIIRCLIESDNSVDLTNSLFMVRYYRYGYKTSEKGMRTTTVIDCILKNELTELSDIYDMTSSNPRVSCVAANPNIVASNWVAVGLECGLIHLQRFSERDFFPIVDSIIDSICPNTKTESLPSTPIKTSKKPSNVRKTATKAIERSDKKKPNKLKANTISNESPQKNRLSSAVSSIESKYFEFTIETTDRKKNTNKKTTTGKSKKSPRKQKRRFSIDNSDSNDINEIIKQSLEILNAEPLNTSKKIIDSDSYDSSATEKMSDSVFELYFPSTTVKNTFHPLPINIDNQSDNQTDRNLADTVEIDLKPEETSSISQNTDYQIDDRLSILEINENYTENIDENRPVELIDQLKVDSQITLAKEKIDDENRFLESETNTLEISWEETKTDYVELAVNILLEKTDDIDGGYLVNNKNTDLSNNTESENTEMEQVKIDGFGTHLVNTDLQFNTESKKTETERDKIDGTHLVNTKNIDLPNNTELENTEMEQDKTDGFGTHLINTDLQFNTESENTETERDKIDGINSSYLANVENTDLPVNTESENTDLSINTVSENTEMERDNGIDSSSYIEEEEIDDTNSLFTQCQPRLKLVSYSSDSEDNLDNSQKNIDSDSEQQADVDSLLKPTSTDYLLSSNPNESVDQFETAISRSTDQTREIDDHNSPSSDNKIHIIFDESDLNVEYSDSDGKSIDNSPFKTIFINRQINVLKREITNQEIKIINNNNDEIQTNQPEAHKRHGNVFQFLNKIQDNFCVKQEMNENRSDSDLTSLNSIENNHTRISLNPTDSDEIIKKEIDSEPIIINEDINWNNNQQIMLNQTNSVEIIKSEVDLETENRNSVLINEDLFTNKVENHSVDSCLTNQNLSDNIHGDQIKIDEVTEKDIDFQSIVEISPVNNPDLLSNNTDACEDQSSNINNGNSCVGLDENCSQILFNQINPDCVIEKEIDFLPSFIISIDNSEELASNKVQFYANQSANIDENYENSDEIIERKNDIETINNENILSTNNDYFEIQSVNIENSRTRPNIDENQQISLDETEIKSGTILHVLCDNNDDKASSITDYFENNSPDLLIQTNSGEIVITETDLETQRNHTEHDTNIKIIETEKIDDQSTEINQLITVRDNSAVTIDNGFQLVEEESVKEEDQSEEIIEKHLDNNTVDNQSICVDENVDKISSLVIKSEIGSDNKLLEEKMNNLSLDIVNENNRLDNSIKEEEVINIDRSNVSDIDLFAGVISSDQNTSIKKEDQLALLVTEINMINNDDNESIKTEFMADLVNEISTNDTASEVKLINEGDPISDTQINTINNDDNDSIKTEIMSDLVNEISTKDTASEVKLINESDQFEDPVFDTQTNTISNQSENRSDLITKIFSDDPSSKAQSLKEGNRLEDSNENKSISENNYQSVVSNFNSIGDTIDSDVNISIGTESHSDITSELSITDPIQKKIRKRKATFCNPDLILPEKRIRRIPPKYRCSPKKPIRRTQLSTPVTTEVKESSIPNAKIDQNSVSVPSIIESTLSRDKSIQSINESDNLIKSEKNLFFDFCEPQNSQSRKRKTNSSQTTNENKKLKIIDEQPVTNSSSTLNKNPKQKPDFSNNFNNKRLSKSNPIKEKPPGPPSITPIVNKTRKIEKLDNNITSILSSPAPNTNELKSPAPIFAKTPRKPPLLSQPLPPTELSSSRSAQKLCTINQYNSQITKLKLETSTDIDLNETPLSIEKISRKSNVVDNLNKSIITANRKSNRLIYAQKNTTAASKTTVIHDNEAPKTNQTSNESVSLRTKGLRNKKEHIELNKNSVTSEASLSVNYGKVSPNTNGCKSGKKSIVENWWHSHLIQIKWLDNKYGEQSLRGVLFDNEPVVGQNTCVKWPRITSKNLYPVTVLKIL